MEIDAIPEAGWKQRVNVSHNWQSSGRLMDSGERRGRCRGLQRRHVSSHSTPKRGQRGRCTDRGHVGTRRIVRWVAAAAEGRRGRRRGFCRGNLDAVQAGCCCCSVVPLRDSMLLNPDSRGMGIVDGFEVGRGDQGSGCGRIEMARIPRRSYRRMPRGEKYQERGRRGGR